MKKVSKSAKGNSSNDGQKQPEFPANLPPAKPLTLDQAMEILKRFQRLEHLCSKAAAMLFTLSDKLSEQANGSEDSFLLIQADGWCLVTHDIAAPLLQAKAELYESMEPMLGFPRGKGGAQ
jgi:hypothetical protein